MKTCNRCGKTKTLDSFHTYRNNELRSYCKSCHNEYNKQWRKRNKRKHSEQNLKHQLRWKLKNIYNATIEDYEYIVNRSGGLCEICKKETKLYIDHDHITGKLRGMICNSCNLGLGKLGDSVKALELALEYLKRNS